MQSVAAYQLMPDHLAVAFGAILPWLELVTAFCLIASRWTSEAALLAISLGVLFLIAQGTAMARGLVIDCGCFARAEEFVGWATIGRTTLFTGLAWLTWWVSRKDYRVMLRSRSPQNKHQFSLLVLLFALLPVLPIAASMQDRGAARQYFRAFDELRTLSEDDWGIIQAYAQNPLGRPANIDQVLERAASAMASLRRAGSDRLFHTVEMERRNLNSGYPSYIPDFRKAMILLKARAHYAAETGDVVGAAESVATIYRMADHVSQGYLPSLSNLSATLIHSAESVRGWMTENGHMTAESSVVMLQAVGLLSPDDPTRVIDAIVAENEATLAFLMVSHDRGEFTAVDEYLENYRRDPIDVSELTVDDVGAIVDEVRWGTARAIEIGMMSDPEEAQDAFNRLKDQLSPEASAFMSIDVGSLSRYLISAHASRDQVQEARKELTLIAGGQIDPKILRNAAVLYIQAAALLDDSNEGDEHTSTETARRVVALLKDATSLEKCDFSAALNDPDHLRSAVPRYLHGLHRAVVEILYDFPSPHDPHDIGPAPDELHALPAEVRLAIGLGVSHHLAQDGPVASSVVASRLFEASMQFADIFRHQLRGRPAVQEDIAEVLERFTAADPFGFRAGAVRQREEWARSLTSSSSMSEVEKVDRRKRISGWSSADFLAASLVALLRGSQETTSYLSRDALLLLQQLQRAQPFFSFDAALDTLRVVQLSEQPGRPELDLEEIASVAEDLSGIDDVAIRASETFLTFRTMIRLTDTIDNTDD